MFLVIQENVCERCSGDKVVEHPLWEEFWKEFENRGFYLPQREVEEFFREKLGWNEDDLPSEEVNCPECGGSGVVRSEVDLAIALSQIIKADPFMLDFAQNMKRTHHAE